MTGIIGASLMVWSRPTVHERPFTLLSGAIDRQSRLLWADFRAFVNANDQRRYTI